MKRFQKLMVGHGLLVLLAAMLSGLMLGFGLIYIGWANTAFYWLGNASSNRAMSFGDNPLGASNLPGVIGFGAALIGAILIFWLLGNAAVRVLGDKPE